MTDQQQSPTQMENSNPANEEEIENVEPQPSQNEQETPHRKFLFCIPVTPTSNPSNAAPGGAGPERANVCCNRCNWSQQTCGMFWAILNLVELVFCYAFLIFKFSFAQGINTSVEGFEKNFVELNKSDAAECIGHLRVSGTPRADAKLSVQILMLAIYTIGSISFIVAVFLKCLNSRRRSLCLLIYLATIACLPLAYIIPIIIDFTGCVYVGIGLLGFFSWWYILILFSAGLAINITFVLRDWILKNRALADNLPPSQQQSVEMGGESPNDTGKKTTDDKIPTATVDKNTTNTADKNITKTADKNTTPTVGKNTSKTEAEA